MKKILFVKIFLIITISYNFGQQNYLFSGLILDSSDETPLPFCNVYVENTSVGTISNNEGKFRIAIPLKTSQNLCVSFIGYKTKKIPIANLKNNDNIIYLEKDLININEVIIIPDSTLLGLLRKAYRSIEKNYPNEPTKLVGFYRETKLTDKDENLYFLEAILNVYKKSYQVTNDQGQIEVIESRKKVFPISKDVNNVQFYAGAFIPIRADIVKTEYEFIDPKHFKKYSYSLSNTFKQDDRIIYEISFDTKNDSLKGIYKGKFFLDKESLAYIKCEGTSTERGIKEYNSSNFTSYKGVERNFFVQYFFFNGKWHLKYCKLFGKGINTKYDSKLKYVDEFLTTEVLTDTIEPVPYEKRLGYYDIFLDKALPYSETDWKDYNIIKASDDLLFSIDQSKKVFEENIVLKKENKIITFIKHFSFTYGLIVFENKIPGGDYQILLDNSTLNQNLKTKEYLIGLDATIAYNFNKNLSIKYSICSSLDKNIHYESNGIGIGYLKNIKPKGKPLLLKLDLFGYLDYYGIVFDKVLKNIEYNNEFISKSKMETSIDKISYGIKPRLSLSYQITKFTNLYIYASYNLNLSEEYIIKFKEESGLFKKTYNENIIDGTVNYNGTGLNESNIDMNPLILGIGFNFGFN
ncbi:MAG: hypothetical protein A2W99_03870 [Bacteroidetes bacterium GWF2_33_16]|nr:MAG: hypothetical protein A2X00_12280 [Bacteroidetes bacterium GWE2_32_14]OFY03631.1 MAG: hypothetical protein A2W99_03870 [Bacteroidetes bacterium GWF2_33_16]